MRRFFRWSLLSYSWSLTSIFLFGSRRSRYPSIHILWVVCLSWTCKNIWGGIVLEIVSILSDWKG